MSGKKVTNRIKQLSLKETPEFHQRLKILASKDNCLMIEVLERSLELYEQVRKERKKAVRENIQPKVSPVPPSTASKHSRDDSAVEEHNPVSKKRKVENSEDDSMELD